MNDYKDPWERIKRIMHTSAHTEVVSHFAKEIGIKRAESLYQIKRGNNGISIDLAAKIKARYPEISHAWILTGEGSYYCPQYHSGIPVYRQVTETINGSFDSELYDEILIKVKSHPPASFGIYVCDDSMAPDIREGSYAIFGREELIPKDHKIYFVETDDNLLIRMVHIEKRRGLISLLPINLQRYGIITLPVNDVRKFYPLNLVISDIRL